MDEKTVLLLAPNVDEIALLERRLEETPALAERICIAAPEMMRAFIVAARYAALAHYAVTRLARVLPRLSAKSRWSLRIARGPTALVAAVLALSLLAPVATVKAAGLLGTLFFLNCSIWKLTAAFGRQRPLRLEAVPPDRLPAYTVLVPLYREAPIVPDLVKHLRALDYPAAKLQVLLVLEADDHASRAAVLRHADSPPFEVVIVPPGGPRTKPKALTYALPFARGDLVAVFDAEDRPEPDQLRKAAAAFREWPDLGCVQARLAPDNEGSWYARMFAVEYAANFEVLLPTLARFGMPLPLGGTSNHFPGIR
jgi:cellulose synthase/poly-beta-1,6-N-acetylglucosamine synthase-like glycosyltransferase